MSTEKEKKKIPTIVYPVFVIMMITFAYQMIFPTNLGKVFDTLAGNALSITVTMTKENEPGVSYYTESPEAIKAFSQWAGTKAMRNRSLADSVTGNSRKQAKYTFSIRADTNIYNTFAIDERGMVHVGARLYKVSGSPKTFLEELLTQLENWEVVEEKTES